MRRLWKTCGRLRAACYIIGSLTGMGVGGTLIWLARRARALAELRADSPEYASDVKLLPSTGLPHIGFGSIPPMLVVVPLLLLAVWLACRMPMAKPDNPFDRDPRRLFTDSDREWIDSCCQHRCEHRYCFGLLRCRYRAQQLDHWYPYAKGGATSRTNLVDLCAKHNNRKSDHVPTRLQTWMLARARHSYFPVEWRGYCKPDGRVEDDDVRDADEEA